MRFYAGLISLGIAILFQNSAVANTVVWDAWYTVTINQRLRYSYYNTKLELLSDNRILLKNHAWKKEEGFINEEQLGAACQNTIELVPLFYNYHSSYRDSETKIDGTIREGKSLSVKPNRNGREMSTVTKSIAAKTIFSVFLEPWLGKHLKTMKLGQSLSFLTLVEDNIEASFPLVPGRAQLSAPDAFSLKTHTQKVIVNYSDRRSIWYVEPNGMSIRILMPDQNTVVEKVTERLARAFLQ